MLLIKFEIVCFFPWWINLSCGHKGQTPKLVSLSILFIDLYIFCPPTLSCVLYPRGRNIFRGAEYSPRPWWKNSSTRLCHILPSARIWILLIWIHLIMQDNARRSKTSKEKIYLWIYLLVSAPIWHLIWINFQQWCILCTFLVLLGNIKQQSIKKYNI